MRRAALVGTAMILTACTGDIDILPADAGSDATMFDGSLDASTPDAFFEPDVSNADVTRDDADGEGVEEPDACAVLAMGAETTLRTSSEWNSERIAMPGERIVGGRFLARVDGDTPHALFGLSTGASSAFSDSSSIVRFASTGIIDVRDGDAYSSDSPVPFDAGEWYEVEVSVDYETRTYSVSVNDCGAAPILLTSDAEFRSDAPFGDLTHLAVWADAGATLEVAALSILTEESDAEPTGWPRTSTEALMRSPYWNPGAQSMHRGSVETSARGQVIENLHIMAPSTSPCAVRTWTHCRTSPKGPTRPSCNRAPPVSAPACS